MFQLGEVVATRGAIHTEMDLISLIRRHQSGDWGDLCDDDKQAPYHAIEVGERVLSRYDLTAHSFYVITEWDRSVTTIMLVDGY
jgi:hypothetical protein